MSDDNDFASVIDRAQRVPAPGNGIAEEVTDLFERPTPSSHRVVDNLDGAKVEGAVEYDYEAHIEYFAIPDSKEAYEQTLNKIMKAEALLRWEKSTFTKEGDFVIVICYLTPIPNKERTEKNRKVLEDEEREEYLRR